MVPLLSISPALPEPPVAPIVIVLSLSISESKVLMRAPVPLMSIVPVVTLLLIRSVVVFVPSPLVMEPAVTEIAPKLSIVPRLV